MLDDKNVRRRFRASNYQSSTRVKPFICTMPMRLDEGWNQIQFNLSDFTRRAYGTNYIETLRVQIHANCRIRRIYFSDRLYSEEELPAEFKLFLPIQARARAAAVDARRSHARALAEASSCGSGYGGGRNHGVVASRGAVRRSSVCIVCVRACVRAFLFCFAASGGGGSAPYYAATMRTSFCTF